MTAETGSNVIANDGDLSQWRCCAQRPGAITDISQLPATETEWIPAQVPGTVASILAANGLFRLEEPQDIDAQDWWFRTSFPFAPGGNRHPAHLRFDGLATLAEVWLNGELLLTTDNMFRGYCVDVSSRLRRDNELVIAFRSLTEDLKRKRPRPRWKTNLVNHQQLRWHRTSLQGRIPGWSPPAPAIGPWRAVRLETGPVTMRSVKLQPQLQGTTGLVRIEARILSANAVQRGSLRVGSHVGALRLEREVDGYSVSGEVHIPDVRQWWPHTHGQPALYDCDLILESGDLSLSVPLSPVGFRKLDVDTGETHTRVAGAAGSASAAGFRVRVNDTNVFCRGACWTVSDFMSLSGTEDQLRHDLTLARDAGMNMLRVGGTMVYESDTFYRLCDKLGILVWQDFMFANMDYPIDDELFRMNVAGEAAEQLTRLAAHPCVAVYCGNSEIQQQAAMLGMPRELWSNVWFAEQLPALCRELHPAAEYVPSTPTGGVLPFQPGAGLTHYYGVGAYLRPVTDVRRSDVKFTPECLGFSNVPEAATIEAITPGAQAVMHDPRWKRRVPRDTGAGWDFEDVRDHYLKDLFQVDPVQLRSRNTSRYLDLSRLVSGEMMQQAFSEWRSSRSSNGGALVWFCKDLWPAAGWGIIDSTGTPKAAYYYLKRTWASRQLVLTDEGLNGLQLHVVNESPAPCNGTVEVLLLKEPNVVVARQELAVRVDGHALRTLSADEILGGFYDVTYAYRFGPPHHDVVVVTWLDAERHVISEAYHFVQRNCPSGDRPVALQTTGELIGDGEYRLTLQSDRFLQNVRVAANGFLPDDNYFHLPPNRTRSVTFRARSTSVPSFKATVEALNMDASHVVAVRSKTT